MASSSAAAIPPRARMVTATGRIGTMRHRIASRFDGEVEASDLEAVLEYLVGA